VRPLYNERARKAQKTTRDYVLKTETTADGLVSGSKLAENALEQPQELVCRRGAPYPGGDFPPTEFNQ
jgi:hypothetical protein